MEDEMNAFRFIEEAGLCDDDDEAEQFRLQLEVGKPCLSSVVTPIVQMRVVQCSSRHECARKQDWRYLLGMRCRARSLRRWQDEGLA